MTYNIYNIHNKIYVTMFSTVTAQRHTKCKHFI